MLKLYPNYGVFFKNIKMFSKLLVVDPGVALLMAVNDEFGGLRIVLFIDQTDERYRSDENEMLEQFGVAPAFKFLRQLPGKVLSLVLFRFHVGLARTVSVARALQVPGASTVPGTFLPHGTKSELLPD